MGIVTSMSQGILSEGEHASRVSLGSLQDVVRNLSRMPGQRSVVVVSPGFIIPDLQYEFTGIVDRAVRAQVVISTTGRARAVCHPSLWRRQPATFRDSRRQHYHAHHS